MTDPTDYVLRVDMTRRFPTFRLLWVTCSLIVAIGMSTARSALADVDTADPRDADNDAVHAFWSDLDAAWNARDAEAFSRLYTDDVSFNFVDRNQSFEGRPSIHRHFSAQFPRMAPNLRHRTQVRDVQAIAPAIVGIDAIVEILRLAEDENSPTTVLRSFDVYAVMTRDGGWLIRAIRIHQRPPNP